MTSDAPPPASMLSPAQAAAGSTSASNTSIGSPEQVDRGTASGSGSGSGSESLNQAAAAAAATSTGRPPAPPPLHALLTKFNMGKAAAAGPSPKSSLPYTTAAQAALFSKQDRPLIQSSNLATPIAATAVPTRTAVLFLGKDWERWHRYDRDSSLQLGWQPRGVASAVTDCRSSPSLSGSSGSSSDSAGSGSDDEYVKHASVFSSDDDYDEEDETHLGRRMSSSQSSGAGHRDDDVFALQRRLTRRARLLSSTSTSTILENASSRPQSPSPFSPSPHIRERRYSSNGPEAAFLRHETVIGIHTPRSPHSTSPASSSGYHTPSERKFSLAPLSQILPSGTARSADDNHKNSRASSSSTATFNSLQLSALSPKVPVESLAPQSGAESSSSASAAAAPPHANRTSSTQTVHPDKTPATRKLSLADAPSRKRSAVSSARNQSTSSQPAAGDKPKSIPAQVQAQQTQAQRSSSAVRKDKIRDSAHGALQQSRSHSHSQTRRSSSTARRRPRRTHLTPAPRCPSVAVEGTLYDEVGPFVEGAVQDGLSVRIFNGPDVPCSSRHTDQGATELGLGLEGASAEEAEESARRSHSSGGHGGVVTYLITTPDNRVSSAAKLRRWAMDSYGNFYAAMEIKSVEAKLRAGGALPDNTPPSSSSSSSASSGMSFEQQCAEQEASYYYSRELIRSMQETYVEDIVSEIQKAQTLNPDRSTVSRLLKTEDGKYVRLEEDYPEEAFFVLVGCEEYELYPVVALVFVQALRALARFHDAGWLHGDVKLENIMFDVHGRLVVIDYENANVFRKPRRRRHHHHLHHHHHSHGHHGQHQHRDARSRRAGSSRPASRRGASATGAGAGAETGAEGKHAGMSPAASPAQRRLALDKAVAETARTASFPAAGPSGAASNGGAHPTETDPQLTTSSGGSSGSGSMQGQGLGLGPEALLSRGEQAGGSAMLMERDGSHASSRGHSYADDEAELSEEEEEEHLVRLISYDWTPPEAGLSPWSANGNGGGNNGGGGSGSGGRMMGPSGDLWALGCNLIRAFALRDGVPDVEVREVLLGTGQRAFFKHRHQVLAELQKAKEDAKEAELERQEASEEVRRSGESSTAASAAAAAVSASSQFPTDKPTTPLEPPSTPAARVLHRFSQEAPRLMQFVLARCVTPHPSERGWEAEAEGLELAAELERERVREPIPVLDPQRSFGSGADSLGQPPLRKVDAEEELELELERVPGAGAVEGRAMRDQGGGADGEAEEGERRPLIMDVAQAAIRKAIDMSGSMWVRPKLEEARRSLGFGADEMMMGGAEMDGQQQQQQHYYEEGGYGHDYDYGARQGAGQGGDGYGAGAGAGSHGHANGHGVSAR
ncbi:hypothetical protein OC844_002428 [Tilletia horrida]|nr:hypothetical protein OC844_002428 [Tilletia horrida]